MKKIIKNRLYDTGTARKVGEYWNGLSRKAICGCFFLV